jgi:hypothetical protein
MSLPSGLITAAAVLALLVGLWLTLLGRGMRQRRGLGGGKNVSLDKVTLTSAGPDRQAGPDCQRGWHDHRRRMEILIAMHLIPWVGGTNESDRSLEILKGVSDSSGFQFWLNQPVSPESAACERLLDLTSS